MKYFIMWITITNTLGMILGLLNKKIQLNKKSIFNKMTPFECGFNPSITRSIPFSNQFFMTSLMFLVFDMEISILLSMIPCLYMSSIYWLIIILWFMILLFLGLALEWWMNSMKWKY